MEADGMMKNKEKTDLEPKVNVSIGVLPFGSIIYRTAGIEYPTQENETKMPTYVEPTTTNIEGIEICYEEGKKYVVPKTTA